jgi:F-type H+-transporting ATPase subunit b
MAEQFTTVEHTPPSEAGAAFPPFDRTTFGSQIIWLILFFGALYLIASRLALPRVGSVLAVRHARIAGDIEAAHRMKDEADAAAAAYEKALAEARARAQAIAGETRAKLTAQAEESRKGLEASLGAKLAEADKAIASTKAAAMANVRGIAQEAAAAIVARLTGVAPPPGAVAAAVDAAVNH